MRRKERMEVGAGYWVKYGLSDRRSDWELRGMGTRPCARPRQRLPGGAGSTSPAHRPQTVRIRCAEPHPALSRVGYGRRGAGGAPTRAPLHPVVVPVHDQELPVGQHGKSVWAEELRGAVALAAVASQHAAPPPGHRCTRLLAPSATRNCPSGSTANLAG